MLKKLFSVCLISCLSLTAFSQLASIRKDTIISTSIKIIPSNFYTKHLGFFCTNEMRLQKTSGINLFFRLGSKEHVDFLEQKPNATRRY
jgi:hypothetical protein